MSKNKTTKVKAVIEWPESHFTIEDIQSKYPKVINITLRFRIKKAEDLGDIVLIGKIKPAIGRPRKVYAKANPSESLLKNAYSSGVIPNDPQTTTIKVVDVESSTKSASSPTTKVTA
jgi:hypothetical protein